MNHQRPGRPVCLPGGLETCPRTLSAGLQGTHHPTRQDPGWRQGTQASDQGQKSCGMSESTKHRQGTTLPALPGRVQPSGLAGGVKTTAASRGHRAWNHDGTLGSWWDPGVTAEPGIMTEPWGHGGTRGSCLEMAQPGGTVATAETRGHMWTQLPDRTVAFPADCGQCPRASALSPGGSLLPTASLRQAPDLALRKRR